MSVLSVTIIILSDIQIFSNLPSQNSFRSLWLPPQCLNTSLLFVTHNSRLPLHFSLTWDSAISPKISASFYWKIIYLEMKFVDTGGVVTSKLFQWIDLGNHPSIYPSIMMSPYSYFSVIFKSEYWHIWSFTLQKKTRIPLFWGMFKNSLTLKC